MTRIVGDRSLDDALGKLNVIASSGLFRIEVKDGGDELNLTGWFLRVIVKEICN
jgi:hypothetical protein